MMKIAPLIAAVVLTATGFAAVQAFAQASQTGASTDSVEERVNRITVYGNDPCPRGAEGEIVVCARRPDNERYRIPENLRKGERLRGGESWAARARSLEYVGATGTMSCSTTGPGGFTGCWAEMMRQAREDQRRNPQPRK